MKNGLSNIVDGSHHEAESRTHDHGVRNEDYNPEAEKGGMEVPEEPDQPRCGLFCAMPDWLQRLHTSKVLLAVLSACALTQGFVVNGMVPVSLSTLELRFKLNSVMSGVFASFYDISTLVALIPISYFGETGHKGRYLGVGMLVLAAGSFVCTLPQVISARYDVGDNTIPETCQPGTNASAILCSLKAGNTYGFAYFLLLFGQFLHGVGAVPLYTLGYTYLDENVPQKSSGMYMGTFMGFSVLGPALGYILGGFLLKIYGDVGKPGVDASNPPVDPVSPVWYGAWWIGFAMSGFMALLFGTLMLCFGRKLPGSDELRKKDVDQSFQKKALKKKPSSEKLGWKKFFAESKDLFRNPTFVCLMFTQAFDAFLVNSFANFLPKVMETLFNVAKSNASLFAGAVLIPGGFLGNLVGGGVIKKYNLKCAAMISLALLLSAVCLPLYFMLMLNCPSTNFVGLTSAYSANQTFGPLPTSFHSDCNSVCSCPDIFKPVCNMRLGLSYYSACHAGCRKTDAKKFEQCYCVKEHETFTNDSTSLLGDAALATEEGYCSTTCPYQLPIYLAVFLLLVFLMFAAMISVQQATLRCVPFNYRTMALGMTMVCYRLFGSIPGPIVFGAAMDSCCVLWEMECGQRQSCRRYDVGRLSIYTSVFALGLKVLSVLCLFLARKFYTAPAAVADVSSPGPKFMLGGDIPLEGTNNGSESAAISKDDIIQDCHNDIIR